MELYNFTAFAKKDSYSRIGRREEAWLGSMPGCVWCRPPATSADRWPGAECDRGGFVQFRPEEVLERCVATGSRRLAAPVAVQTRV